MANFGIGTLDDPRRLRAGKLGGAMRADELLSGAVKSLSALKQRIGRLGQFDDVGIDDHVARLNGFVNGANRRAGEDTTHASLHEDPESTPVASMIDVILSLIHI